MDVPDNATLSNLPTGTTGGIVGTSSATLPNPGYSPSGAAGTSSTPSAEANYDSSNSKSGVVIGSVLGSIAFVGVVALLILYRRLRKKRGLSVPIISTFNQQRPQSYRTMRSSHLPWQGSIYNGNTGSVDQQSHNHSPSRSDLASEMTLVPVRRETFGQYNKSQDELRAVRQMEINLRLQSAQQEMQNLTSRQLMHGDFDTSSEYGRRDTEHEMGTMREQICELRAQIEQLQAERSSDWAQGLSDEPPPAYC